MIIGGFGQVFPHVPGKPKEESQLGKILGPCAARVEPIVMPLAPPLFPPFQAKPEPLLFAGPLSTGPKLLSILILTLKSRKVVADGLLRKIENQIAALRTLRVEVVVFEDDRQHPIGAKRNRLLKEAQGEFVAFVDDDDDIADDYVFQILDAILRSPEADCIGMRGVITFAGRHPRGVTYSLQNRMVETRDGVYLRTPCHLTPVRRSIAARVGYREVNFGEDTAWGLAVLPLIKKEAFIDKVLYHYRFNPRGALPPIPNDPRPYSVVILSANADNLRPCLKSIRDMEPFLEPGRVVVVDDGVGDSIKAEFPGTTWVPGQKPFCFARNANLGIRAAGTDVILLNDDARLTSLFGFTSMSHSMRGRAQIGLCSAAIEGVVGNRNQRQMKGAQLELRTEGEILVFIGVFIPWHVWQTVGPLDEQFTGYGFEDNDYCRRVANAGLRLAIYDGCVVEHGKHGSPSFRSRPDLDALFSANRERFAKKWSKKPGT